MVWACEKNVNKQNRPEVAGMEAKYCPAQRQARKQWMDNVKDTSVEVRGSTLMESEQSATALFLDRSQRKNFIAAGRTPISTVYKELGHLACLDISLGTGSLEYVALHKHLLLLSNSLFLASDVGLRNAVVLLCHYTAAGDCCLAFSSLSKSCQLRTGEAELE